MPNYRKICGKSQYNSSAVLKCPTFPLEVCTMKKPHLFLACILAVAILSLIGVYFVQKSLDCNTHLFYIPGKQPEQTCGFGNLTAIENKPIDIFGYFSLDSPRFSFKFTYLSEQMNIWFNYDIRTCDVVGHPKGINCIFLDVTPDNGNHWLRLEQSPLRGNNAELIDNTGK